MAHVWSLWKLVLYFFRVHCRNGLWIVRLTGEHLYSPSGPCLWHVHACMFRYLQPGFWGWNSGPHACVVDNLLTEYLPSTPRVLILGNIKYKFSKTI